MEVAPSSSFPDSRKTNGAGTNMDDWEVREGKGRERETGREGERKKAAKHGEPDPVCAAAGDDDGGLGGVNEWMKPGGGGVEAELV